MNTIFDPRTAALLAERVGALHGAATELASLGEHDPGLAGECGVEVCALEARTILSGGAAQRIAVLSAEAARAGRPVSIGTVDLEAVSRLEAVVSLGSSRIGLRLASLDAAASQEPIAKWGGLIGLASGAVGLIRSLF